MSRGVVTVEEHPDGEQNNSKVVTLLVALPTATCAPTSVDEMIVLFLCTGERTDKKSVC